MELASIPNPQTTSFKLNNFDITLSHDNDQLTIDAEQENTLKHFYITVTPENIKDLTNFLFRDIQVMYLDLLEAFEEKAAGVKISITDDARIMYSQERQVRGNTVKEEFTLWLDEEKIDEQKKQEKRIDKLLKQVAQLEERIVIIENENAQKTSKQEERIAKLESENASFKCEVERMIKRMEQKSMQKIEALEEENIVLTERITALEKGVIPKAKKAQAKVIVESEKEVKLSSKPQELANIDCQFDPTCKHAASYSMLNGCKTIKYNLGGAYSVCFAKDPLIRSQKTIFSIKVDCTRASDVIIGICPSNWRNEKFVHLRSGVYAYSGYKLGKTFVNGGENKLEKAGFGTGSVVTVNVDLLNHTITFQLDGTSIITLNLDQSQIKSYDYYPFIELGSKGDQLSFI